MTTRKKEAVANAPTDGAAHIAPRRASESFFVLILAATVLGMGTPGQTWASPPRSLQASDSEGPNRVEPIIEIKDVERFYRLFDAAHGRPTAQQLQDEYLDAGSSGLHVLARLRNVTGARMAEAIAARPEIYEGARRCAAVLPRVRLRLSAAFDKLADLYPRARFPPVTIAVGRGRPVGVGGQDTGVQIGLEALCAATSLNPNVEDRFVYVIVHELVHVQQPPESDAPTVLQASIMEGVAEFVTELICGQVAYFHLAGVVAGREAEIEASFLVDIDNRELSAWLYNTTPQNAGDLGYWVGYRIAKAHYRRSGEKSQAVREMIEVVDAKAFLAASGWRPGMKLD